MILSAGRASGNLGHNPRTHVETCWCNCVSRALPRSTDCRTSLRNSFTSTSSRPCSLVYEDSMRKLVTFPNFIELSLRPGYFVLDLKVSGSSVQPPQLHVSVRHIDLQLFLYGGGAAAVLAVPLELFSLLGWVSSG